MITVVVADEDGLRTERVRNYYTEFNRLVRGSISSLAIPNELRRWGIVAFCDDDGLQHAQPPNPYAAQLGRFKLVGPTVFLRESDSEPGEVQDMTPEEVIFLQDFLSKPPTPEALVDAERERIFWMAHPSGMAIYDGSSGDWREVE